MHEGRLRILPQHQTRILKQMEWPVDPPPTFKELSEAEYFLRTHMMGPGSCGRLAQVEEVAVDIRWAADGSPGNTDRRQAPREHVLEDPKVLRFDSIYQERVVV